MFLIHITNPKSFVFNFWGSLHKWSPLIIIHALACVPVLWGGGKEKSTNEDLSDSEDRIGKIKKCEPQRQGL